MAQVKINDQNTGGGGGGRGNCSTKMKDIYFAQ